MCVEGGARPSSVPADQHGQVASLSTSGMASALSPTWPSWTGGALSPVGESALLTASGPAQVGFAASSLLSSS